MKKDNIDNLLLKNEKFPCISIIVPTDSVNAKRNHEILRKSVRQAKALLKNKGLSDKVSADLISKLEMCAARIPETISEGLGFFISQTQFHIVTFPFEVKNKVTVDASFASRDLLYLKQYSTPYYVLNLSRKSVHLFKGVLNDLEEIKDKNFPLLYVDQFEYQPAASTSSSSTSLKGYEREKNQISEIRLRTVFREADAFVKGHLHGDSKVLLAGTQKMVSLFTSITTLGKRLVARIAGSYDENTFQKLRENSWSAYCRITKRELTKQIRNLQEKRGGHLAEGIQDAWTAASEGKGLMLVVEKDLHHRAYRKEGQNTIQLQPPKKPYVLISDVVDDLIETVHSKNGKLLLADNGELKEFDHLALVLRY